MIYIIFRFVFDKSKSTCYNCNNNSLGGISL